MIGAGIVGACAAFELAARGARTTIFEQFDVDHDRGSSYGGSRIIRRFYDDPFYTALSGAAYEHWATLERASGRSLYRRLGGLYFGPSGHARLASARAGMTAVGAEPLMLDARTMRARFPAFAFDDDEAGIVDERAGSLHASACVIAAIESACAAGALLRSRTHVDAFEPTGGGFEVRHDGERERFDRVLVCAGPWSRQLLAQLALPLTITRQQYAHLRPIADAASFQAGVMPIWIDAASDWYGFPEHGDVAGVKFASHRFGRAIDPDDPDRSIDESLVVEARAYARRRLPALADGAVTYAKICLYSVTPDEDFILDGVPDAPGAYLFCGCSGHAFKFASLIGAILSDLACDVQPRAPIDRFRLARFTRRDPERDGASGA